MKEISPPAVALGSPKSLGNTSRRNPHRRKRRFVQKTSRIGSKQKLGSSRFVPEAKQEQACPESRHGGERPAPAPAPTPTTATMKLTTTNRAPVRERLIGSTAMPPLAAFTKANRRSLTAMLRSFAQPQRSVFSAVDPRFADRPQTS